MNKQKGFAHILILVISFLVVFTVLAYYVVQNKQKTKEKDLVLLNIPTESTRDRNSNNENTKVPTNNTLFYEDDKIVEIDSAYNKTNIVRIDNYIFYIDENKSVYAQNVNDGEKTLIYTKDQIGQIVGKDDIDYFEWDLFVFNNTPILRLNAYLKFGYLFKIDPNNLQSKNLVYHVEKITNYPRLQKMINDDLLSISFGDGCGFSSNYKRFDFDNFSSYGDVFTFNNSNILVSNSLNYDKFLLSDAITIPSDDFGCGTIEPQNLKSVYFEEQEKTLISNENMPINSRSLYFDESTQRVYILTSDSLYYFDLLNSELVFIGNFESSLEYSFIQKVIDKDRLCIYKSLVDINTVQILSENSTLCEVSDYDVSVLKVYEDLQLPPQYSLQ